MILTYQAHKCSPEGICFTLREYIPLIKVWTCGPVLWSVGWGVSRRYCHSCSPCSHHRIIMKFSGVITMVKSDVHAKGQGQRSRSQRSTPNLAVSGLLTPVWIHIWQWNHAHSWKQHRRGALLFFKIIRQISRSHGSKNRRIWTRLGVSGL